MSTRGRRILIGIAAFVAIGVLGLRGCAWLVLHAPEPRIIEIKRDQTFDWVERLVQLSQNPYSQDLLLKYYPLNQRGNNAEIRNHSDLMIREGDKYEGGPSRKGLVKGDKLVYGEPITFLLCPEGGKPREPAVKIEIGKDGRIVFWGARAGVANLIIPIIRDSRVKLRDDGEYLGVLIINITVAPASGTVQPEAPEPKSTGSPLQAAGFFYNKISIVPRRGHKALKALLI
ncbi:MAG: hypothetical protein WCG99_03170 [Candidatus Berkelbacteria bacterium]